MALLFQQMDTIQVFKSRVPFAMGAKVAYFLCQAPDIQHSLRLARERSYWGVSGGCSCVDGACERVIDMRMPLMLYRVQLVL